MKFGGEGGSGFHRASFSQLHRAQTNSDPPGRGFYLTLNFSSLQEWEAEEVLKAQYQRANRLLSHCGRQALAPTALTVTQSRLGGSGDSGPLPSERNHLRSRQEAAAALPRARAAALRDALEPAAASRLCCPRGPPTPRRTAACPGPKASSGTPPGTRPSPAPPRSGTDALSAYLRVPAGGRG